ncbi:MAG TPA: ATP-binding protein [Woeseiaceae bacterium]|nr:ATP-binding protein [Woeseiaceae bacterium]
MNLRRQLLLVSLLTLMLPWAGCQFIRETESALRTTQQQMLAGTARAVADSLSRYPEDFPLRDDAETAAVRNNNQLYGHQLQAEPAIDGYFSDWTIGEESLREMPGSDGAIRYAIGLRGSYLYLYVAVSDPHVVYADVSSMANADGPAYADRVELVSSNPPYLEERFSFAAEAPGPVVAYLQNSFGFSADATVRAYWQDVPAGYRLEARIPRSKLGTHLGLVVQNTSNATDIGVRNSSYSTTSPGEFVSVSPELGRVASELVQQGMRLIVTDPSGWRIASAGNVETSSRQLAQGVSRWLRYAYDAVVESGTRVALAEPDASGREQQDYVVSALAGNPDTAWFRSKDSSRAIVAVSEPVRSGSNIIGAVVLQQGTDAILSLTNKGLARLMNVTLVSMLLLAAGLLGYASWLSRRIQKLSDAAVDALAHDRLQTKLPSSGATDEIGKLSRSFSSVLAQLGDYNEYLRTLASKLSHEMRTPLAIVTSSLENLEQESLSESSAAYTARAKGGADRLRRILGAMSEANRVEELVKNAEMEEFNLGAVLKASATAYQDIYTTRRFEVDVANDNPNVHGSPELVIQMLDKLVDNAVSFSAEGDTIELGLHADGPALRLDVSNPGPALPETMRSQLFDSMVSVRAKRDDKHLGLGLYIARIIVAGHDGRIDARNIDGGVCFSVWFPCV